MHFAIDVREACKLKKSGKGQWVYGFTEELLRRGYDSTLLSDSPPPEQWVAQAKDIRLFPTGWKWHWRAMRFLQSQKDIDVYISPTSFIVPFAIGRQISVVPVVHDLIAFRGDPHAFKATIVERCTLGRCLHSARYILAVSESTKKDLLLRYPSLAPESIAVVHAGPMRKAVTEHESDNKTILCPATLCPRKNQKRLILAYRKLPAELRDAYRLTLIGARGWHDQDIVDLAQNTSGVEWLDYVTDEEYERFLHSCHVLALPSLYEGFGMQVLDALQRGIPVLTTERGSLQEVAGNCAVLVQPEIEDDIARGLLQILTQDALRERLRNEGPQQAAKFSWEKSVDTFLQATAKMPW